MHCSNFDKILRLMGSDWTCPSEFSQKDIENLNTGDFDRDLYIKLLEKLIEEVALNQKDSDADIPTAIEKYLEKNNKLFEKQHQALLVLPKKTKEIILYIYSKSKTFNNFLELTRKYSVHSYSLSSLFSLWATLDY